MNNRLLRRFQEYDAEKPEIVTEISGLLGIPINGSQTVEVPNRNSFVYVRLRNSTNELIQAFNEKVSPVYGLPVLVKWVLNRYEIISRDTNRYSDWGSFSAFLPRHGSQHSLNFEDGQGGDVSFIYSRQFMPFATIPSGTDGAGTVFVMPHVYRGTDASWNYIGAESSANFLPAKPTGTSARMMILVWDLSTSDPLIITGSFLSASLTGTSSVLSAIPTVTNQNYIPLAAIRLVSGTQSLLWDNIYDMRQYAVTTPPPFAGGFAVQDEGTPIGTGTALNFVGANVEASIAGGVVRVFITGSTGGSVNTGTLDSLYLRLNASNDPITDRLIIQTSSPSSDDAGLRVVVSGTSAVESPYGLMVENYRGHGIKSTVSQNGLAGNFVQYITSGSVNTEVLSVYRSPESEKVASFSQPTIVVRQWKESGTITGGLLEARSENIVRVFLNPDAQGTGTLAMFDTDQVLSYNANLLSLRTSGNSKFYINASGTAYSNGSPLIKEAPVDGNQYARKNAGWEPAAGAAGPAGPPGAFGVFGQDEGINLGTGTTLNFVGSGVTASRSGTVLNVSIPGGGGTSYITTIFDQTAPTAGQATFDVQVSGTYSRIEIMLNGRVEEAATNDPIFLSFNGDTTDANYRYGQHRAASTHAYTAGDGRRIAILPGATATRPNAPGSFVITILDPFNSSYEKAAIAIGGMRFVNDSEIWDYYTQWENTSPITRIALNPALNSDFTSGTHCKILGYE